MIPPEQHPLRKPAEKTDHQKALEALRDAFIATVGEAANILQLYADEHHGRTPPKGRAYWAVSFHDQNRLNIGRPEADTNPESLSLWGIPVRANKGVRDGELQLMISYQKR